MNVGSFPNVGPVQRSDLCDQIAQDIEEMILGRHLEPGSRLPSERELADRFNVSRLTVSVALQVLEQRGLIERKPGRGTTVREVPRNVVSDSIHRYLATSDGRIEDLMKARLALELTAVEMAVRRATPEDLDAMKKWVNEIEEAYTYQEMARYVDADIRFHHSILVAGKSELITALVTSLHQWNITCLNVAVEEKWNEEGARSHRPIYNAVAARKIGAAKKAVKKHMEIARRVYREADLWDLSLDQIARRRSGKTTASGRMESSSLNHHDQ